MTKKLITYSEAISAGTVQSMENNNAVIVLGIGVDYPSGIFGTTNEAYKKFGPSRVLDTPAIENSLTGICIGASLYGLKPILVHARADFMILSLDQIINVASKWQYMFGGNAGNASVVVRAIIGKGWGQGATHSQSLHTVLSHFPGLRVLMPASPSDAKGMLTSSIQSKDPIVIFEHRSLYDIVGEVEEDYFEADILSASIVQKGSDVTVVAASYQVQIALDSAKILSEMGIDVELIDLRVISPIDKDTVLQSVRKTKRLVVVDGTWSAFGLGSEIIAIVSETLHGELICPPLRLANSPNPAPVSRNLEEAFYVNSTLLTNRILEIFDNNLETKLITNRSESEFQGPY